MEKLQLQILNCHWSVFIDNLAAIECWKYDHRCRHINTETLFTLASHRQRYKKCEYQQKCTTASSTRCCMGNFLSMRPESAIFPALASSTSMALIREHLSFSHCQHADPALDQTGQSGARSSDLIGRSWVVPCWSHPWLVIWPHQGQGW